MREYTEYDETNEKNIAVKENIQTKIVLKTLCATGWTSDLIPDENIKNAFLQSVIKDIEKLEEVISEKEQSLLEYIKSLEIEEDENEEEEGKSAITIKTTLKALVKDLKDSATASALKQVKEYEKMLNEIKEKEDEVKLARKNFNNKEKILEKKIEEKRGQFTEEEAKKLILQKLFEVLKEELDKYLKAEVKKTVAVFEKFWDKYHVPMKELTRERDDAVKKLDKFMKELGYE